MIPIKILKFIKTTYFPLVFSAIFSSIEAYAADGKFICTRIENAQIKMPNQIEETPFGHANVGHQIGPGHHTVLSIRRAENDERSVDSDRFLKATLEVDEMSSNSPFGGGMEINLLRGFYTEGSVGFVPKGQYLWSDNLLHSIRIVRNVNGLELIVNAEFEATLSATAKKYPVHLQFDCPINKLTIEELTPWEGSIGTSWASFYSDYRPQSLPRGAIESRPMQ